MLLYTMLYIVLAYLMLFAALTNSVCLNNASFFFLFKYFLCQGYELSGEIALKNNHYYYTILNENEATRLPTNAGQFRPTSVWPPMTPHNYQTGQSLPYWPAIICPSSSPSNPNCPRLMGLGEPTSTSRKRTGHVILKPATNTLLKPTKQELSNKPRRPSGKQ